MEAASGGRAPGSDMPMATNTNMATNTDADGDDTFLKGYSSTYQFNKVDSPSARYSSTAHYDTGSHGLYRLGTFLVGKPTHPNTNSTVTPYARTPVIRTLDSIVG